MRKLGFTGLLLLAVGCASTTVYTRPGAIAPNPTADKFVVMPVNISGLPGDTMAQQAALFGGIIASFKDAAVSLQPIQPALDAAGFGTLGDTIADGMHHMVSFHNAYDFNEDAGFHGGNSEYKVVLESSGKLVELVANELQLSFKPKYIVVASIDSVGSSVPKTVKYRVIAGLYNLEEKKVDEVVWFEQSTAEDETAILAEMGTLGGKLHGLLLAQKAAEGN